MNDTLTDRMNPQKLGKIKISRSILRLEIDDDNGWTVTRHVFRFCSAFLGTDLDRREDRIESVESSSYPRRLPALFSQQRAHR